MIKKNQKKVIILLGECFVENDFEKKMNSEIRGMKYWLNLKLYLIENLINALHLVS